MAAAEAGADAIGFIFAPESPRYISSGAVRKIVEALPPLVATVAVFTAGGEKEIQRAIDECGVDLIQFHGPFLPEAIRPFAARAIRAIRVRDEASLDEISAAPARAVLLDAYHEAQLGGSGRAFDWKIAAKGARSARVILAGGLTPENVSAAIAQVRPYGVDVSSGVELKKGKKDAMKIKRFIEAAKRAGGRNVVAE